MTKSKSIAAMVLILLLVYVGHWARCYQCADLRQGRTVVAVVLLLLQHVRKLFPAVDVLRTQGIEWVRHLKEEAARAIGGSLIQCHFWLL